MGDAGFPAGDAAGDDEFLDPLFATPAMPGSGILALIYSTLPIGGAIMIGEIGAARLVDSQQERRG